MTTRPISMASIKTLIQDIRRDIDYAEGASRRHWTAYQKRRSAISIGRKKAKLRRLVAALPSGVALGLWEALEAWWAELWLDHHQSGYDHSRPAGRHAYDVIKEVEVRLLERAGIS